MGKKKVNNAQGLAMFARFRQAGNEEKLFRYPTCHPSEPTGFCYCDGPFLKEMGFYLRTTILNIVLQLPFNNLTIWLLRNMGAKIGNNVYISAGAWIDSMFLDLLTIEDNVLIGMGAKISFHAFAIEEFIAGRVTLRKGAVIGGFSMIGPGVEVGEFAMVAGGAVIGKDVPPNSIAGGNPARMISR